MAPKLKFVRPGTGSVGLDDLQFFEPFIPLAVSPSNHVFGFLVGRCEVAQRHFFLAVGEDLIEMFPDQECKALESIHPAPFQGVDPSSEKLDANNRQHSQDAEVGWDACACVSGGWFSHRWSAQTRLRAGTFGRGCLRDVAYLVREVDRIEAGTRHFRWPAFEGAIGEKATIGNNITMPYHGNRYQAGRSKRKAG